MLVFFLAPLTHAQIVPIGSTGVSSLTWGAMDYWLPINPAGQSIGTQLTTTIMANGSVGGGFTASSLPSTTEAGGTPLIGAKIAVATSFTTPSDTRGQTAINTNFYNGGTTETANFDLGIYTDSSGVPSLLVCHIGPTSISVTGFGTFTQSLTGSSCPTLTASTNYWVAYISDSATAKQVSTNAACAYSGQPAVFSQSGPAQATGVLPASFGTATSTGKCYNFWVTMNGNTGATTYSLTGSTTGMTVGADTGGIGGSVTVNGTLYPATTTTQSFANLDTSGAFFKSTTVWEFVNSTTANVSTMVVNGYYTPGPPSNNNGLFDVIVINGSVAGAVAFQLSPVNTNCGSGVCINLESSFPSTTHSGFISLTQGHRYSFSFLWDEVGGTAKLAIFDPSSGFAQVGSTVTVTQHTGDVFGNFTIGNAETGTSAGTTSFIGDLMFDWTHATFPNKPH
jgi:hypothetical protein